MINVSICPHDTLKGVEKWERFTLELRNLNEGISDVLKSISSNDNFLTLYKKSPILKDYIKNSLNLFLSKNIKHVFMITKINNHFAYVYNAKESVPIGFPFMPDRDELPFIFKAYNTKNVIIYKHNGFVKAGFSMYYPILVNKQEYPIL